MIYGTQIELPARSRLNVRAEWNPMLGRTTFVVVGAPNTEALLTWLREFVQNIEGTIQNIENREGG